MNHARAAGVCLVVLSCLSRPAQSKSPDAAEILQKAEDVRSPDVDYAADLTIGILDSYVPGVVRTSNYAMVAHGKDDAMIVALTPASFFGVTMLINDRAFWLLFPKASTPFQLAAMEIFQGDASNGDLVRMNLVANYAPESLSREVMDGEKCWRIELAWKHITVNYPRIDYWITERGFRPKKFEYYDKSGAKLKIARYEDYRSGPLGVRPMRVVIENATGPDSKTTLVFANFRKIDASRVTFTPEGEVRFRDAVSAARKGDETVLRLEDGLAALPAGK